MTDVYIASDNIISSLGFTTEENMASLHAGKTGIGLRHDSALSPSPFWASLVNTGIICKQFSAYADPLKYTRFEQMVIESIRESQRKSWIDLSSDRVLFILSSTKGNIGLLDPVEGSRFESDRVYLWKTANIIQRFFGFKHTPLVVSNACISGVLAILIGARLIRAKRFDHVIVTGADLVSEFVLSGFNSFQSLSSGPSKPFDKDRQGLSLGEAAGTVILTHDRSSVTDKEAIFVSAGFSSNDANHISGPSRTGEGLYLAIKRTLEQTDRNIDYISAHGTATPYNDEMEAIAITRAGLQHVPVNSLKGYWGHTLGAAGIIESIAGFHALRKDIVFATQGFSSLGVTNPITIINKVEEIPVRAFLKIASGFGGCNASLLYCK